MAELLTFHIIVKKNLDMLTNKSNRHKDIMVGMLALLPQIFQDIWLNPWHSNIALTLPSVSILVWSKTEAFSNQAAIVVDLIDIRVAKLQGQDRHTMG